MRYVWLVVAALVVALANARVCWHGVLCRPALYVPKIALKLRAIVLKIGMNIADAERALLLLDDGLRSAGVPYWLSEGTALGVYRAGALIPGDDDIDIAVRHEHRDALLRRGLPALRALGFEPIWIRNEGLFVELRHTALGISVDIDVVSEHRRCLTVQGEVRRVHPVPRRDRDRRDARDARGARPRVPAPRAPILRARVRPDVAHAELKKNEARIRTSRSSRRPSVFVFWEIKRGRKGRGTGRRGEAAAIGVHVVYVSEPVVAVRAVRKRGRRSRAFIFIVVTGRVQRADQRAQVKARFGFAGAHRKTPVSRFLFLLCTFIFFVPRVVLFLGGSAT
jgi:hypothetical protein